MSLLSSSRNFSFRILIFYKGMFLLGFSVEQNMLILWLSTTTYFYSRYTKLILSISLKGISSHTNLNFETTAKSHKHPLSSIFHDISGHKYCIFSVNQGGTLREFQNSVRRILLYDSQEPFMEKNSWVH